MLSTKTHRRSVLFLAIVLILTLSIFVGLDHRSCADHHCPVCRLLRPLLELLPLALVFGAVVLVPLLWVHIRVAASAFAPYGATPVKQKIKLTI